MTLLPPDPLFCFRSNMGHIHNVCFINETSEEGDFTRLLLAATESGDVYIWDLEMNRLKSKQHMGSSIQAVHATSDGKVITQEKSGTVTLWELGSVEYEKKANYVCESGFCKSILFDDNRLIVPQENSSIDLVNISTMELISNYPTDYNYGHVMCLTKIIVNKKCYILGGFETGDVVMWDYESKSVVSKFKFHECITSLTFDSHHMRGVIASISNALQVFGIDKSLNLSLKCEIALDYEVCNVVKLRKDGKIFTSGHSNGELRVFSWKTLRTLAVLNEHKDAITDVQFSDYPVNRWGDKIIVATSADGMVSLWSLYN